MIKEFIEFLESLKMTIVSAIFLLLSLVFMFYDIKFINPAWITVFISGTPIVYSAFYKLFKCRCISSALLITIAMIASIVIDELFAAGEVALIMAIGEILEDITVNKAKRGLGRLLELTPTEGHRVLQDDTIEKVNLDQIQKEDILRILPGETIPTDGIICKGSSSINQATLTGESIPVDKTIGDTVMAGTINCFGVIDIKVQNIKDTYLQKMINLVKEAEHNKAPTQKIVDKWASILVPSALAIALFTYILTGEIVRAVTILVVFCPCALVLATPTSIMAAIGHATKRGILIKSGAALEEMGKVNVMVFDKTGTLTSGKIHVSDILSLNKKFDERSILSLCASIEKYSEHALARSIIEKSENKQVALFSVDNFTMFPGKGVSGIINDKQIIVGNLKFIVENNIAVTDDILESLQKLQKQGKAIVIIAYHNEIIGIIALSDKIREGSAYAISSLEKATIKTMILTGDNEITATYIAKILGIKTIYANLLPDEKVKKIIDLQKDGNAVCTIGDGINDAPALKISNVGIAMGNIGSDIAIDAADITFINDDIAYLPYLRKLAILTLHTIKINISFSMCLNFLGIILSIYGLLTPVSGAIVHNLGSVLVILNAARLYDTKLDK